MGRESGRVVNYSKGEKALLIICDDITETKRLSEKLEYQTTHDVLTGLINRVEFDRRLSRILETNLDDEATEHALCYLDLDQFKIINDTCGHLAGDELLRQLSSLLSSIVRKRDTLARLGGDEFAILMEYCDLKNSRRVAENVRTGIENFRFVWEGKRFSMSVSIGLIQISDNTGSMTGIMSAADAACFAAKDAGRNRIHVYHPKDIELSERQGEMQWVSRVTEALEDERLLLYKQAIISLGEMQANQGEHYELLIRMKNEDGSIAMPGAFLPAAERYNIATKIDRWVIKTAFLGLPRTRKFLIDYIFVPLIYRVIH